MLCRPSLQKMILQLYYNFWGLFIGTQIGHEVYFIIEPKITQTTNVTVLGQHLQLDGPDFKVSTTCILELNIQNACYQAWPM